MKVRAVLEGRHTALLVGLLAVITLAVTYATIELLYRTAIVQERHRLLEMAGSQARLIEAVTRDELAESRGADAAQAAALAQVAEAYAGYQGLGKTGEFAIAQRKGDSVVFLLASRYGALQALDPIPFNSKLAEPMQRALRGESGTMIGRDYRGVEVLAAFEPVAASGLGVVAKIGLAEIEAPYVRAAWSALLPAFAAIVLGALAFTRVSRPLLRRMKETQERYEDIVELMGDGVAFQGAEGKLVYANERMCQMLGYARRQVVGRSVAEFFHADNRSTYREQMAKRRKGEAENYEAVLQRRDGTPIHVLIAPRVLRGPSGEFAGSFAVISEITDLKRTEEELRREKERAQLYLDIVGVMVVALDAEGRIELVNRRGLEILGYGVASDLVGRDWFSTCVPEEVRDEVRRVFGKIMVGEVAAVERFENAVVTRGGERRIILWHNAILRDSDGRIRGTLSSGDDITELRAQSERLAHVNAVLRAIRNVNQLISRETDRSRLLEQACRALVATEGVRHAWVVELDPGGKPLRVGEAGIGEAFAILREPLLRGEFPACCRRVLAAGEPVVLLDPTRECAGCPANITHGGTAAVAVALRHEAHVHGVLVVAIPTAWATDDEELSLFREVAGDLAFALHSLDATEARRRAEEALRQSEVRYRSLFENAILGIYQTTPDGRILATNPALVKMLGFDSFEELAARNLEEEGYAPEYSREAFKERLERNGSVLGNEAAWKRADGSTVHVRENAVAVRDAEGRILYYEGTVEDVTARWEAEQAKTQLEAQLRQTQKLESIGTLASGIAHEINNPLTGIINYAELIRTRTGEANLREFAAQIIDEGNRVAKTVRNLLSFARQEKESHSPARIVDIVDGTLSLVAAVLRKDQIEVAVDVPADLPSVRCRSQQIKQVLLNLLTNARDALNARFPGHDDRKRIEIRAGSVVHSGRRWVRLTVEDRGIGIPKAIRDRIFDPFFTTKPRDEGTGLGLAISYGIVRDHRGTLTVESEENTFTRFTVELPADERDVGEATGEGS